MIDIERLKENGRRGLQQLATSFGLVRGAALSSLCFLAWGFAAALTPIPVAAQLSAPCTGATPTTTFGAGRIRTLSHPEYEARDWKVLLRTGPSMDCGSATIRADDNLRVEELGAIETDQSWSLLRFTQGGTTAERWAETRFLEGGGSSGSGAGSGSGSAGGAVDCSGSAVPSTSFGAGRIRTLSHPEYEARDWKVLLRTGPSMDCGSATIRADDNLRVEELGAIETDQSWSLLRFTQGGTTAERWAETRFLEGGGSSGSGAGSGSGSGSGGAVDCSGAAVPSTPLGPERIRTLSHPEYEARDWKVLLRTGPSMACESNAIRADDNLRVDELGTVFTDQDWSLLRFTQSGTTAERWAETRFIEGGGGSTAGGESNGGGGSGNSITIGAPPDGAPVVIFDTDMGPDIDDALALAALHAYADQGKAVIKAVTLSRNSDPGARYIDLLNTFYGRPDIPIGIFQGTTDKDTADSAYTQDIINSGKYPHSLESALPEGHLVMRDVLEAAPDNSVVIIQVGFSTNTARLLEVYPDLVARKVRLLSVMAGNFDMPGGTARSTEFNINIHPSSAQTVFSRWPTRLLVSEFDLGGSLLYPLTSILTDFESPADHPIKDSYLNTTYSWHPPQGDYYDMRSWDITSVIAAIEPDLIPVELGPGKVTVSNDQTSFSSGEGSHYVLAEARQLSAAQRLRLRNRMIDLVSAPPGAGQTPSAPPPANPIPAAPPVAVLAPPPAPDPVDPVLLVENPFQCNGLARTAAVVSGFDDGENVRVTVRGGPAGEEVYDKPAPGGRRTIGWRCDAGGSDLSFSYLGSSSGRSGGFTLRTFNAVPQGSGGDGSTPTTSPNPQVCATSGGCGDGSSGPLNDRGAGDVITTGGGGSGTPTSPDPLACATSGGCDTPATAIPPPSDSSGGHVCNQIVTADTGSLVDSPRDFACQYRTDHLVILYNSSRRSIVESTTDPSVVEKLALLLDAAYDKYINDGFSAPVVDVDHGLIRVSLTSDGSILAPAMSREGVIQFRNSVVDFSDSDSTNYSEYLAYHEVFHQFQWNYMSSRNGVDVVSRLRGALESMADYAALRALGRTICRGSCLDEGVKSTLKKPWNPAYKGELFFLFAEEQTGMSPGELTLKFMEGLEDDGNFVGLAADRMYAVSSSLLSDQAHHDYRVWTLTNGRADVVSAVKSGATKVNADRSTKLFPDPIEAKSMIFEVDQVPGELMLAIGLHQYEQLLVSIVDCRGVRRNETISSGDPDLSLGITSSGCGPAYVVISHSEMNGKTASSNYVDLEATYWVR